MKALFRVLGTVAAVAVTGAAIVVLDKFLNQKDPLHVEAVEFPDLAEDDAEEAAQTAEAYAHGAAETPAPEAAPAEDAAEAPAEPAAPAPEAAEAPAEQPAPAKPVKASKSKAKAKADPDAPNQNPVEAAPAVAPKDENGNFDPTKIADPSDFGDWEEQGCKS